MSFASIVRVSKTIRAEAMAGPWPLRPALAVSSVKARATACGTAFGFGQLVAA
jgi:hypothetical protein